MAMLVLRNIVAVLAVSLGQKTSCDCAAKKLRCQAEGALEESDVTARLRSELSGLEAVRVETPRSLGGASPLRLNFLALVYVATYETWFLIQYAVHSVIP